MFELWALEETAFQTLMETMRTTDLAAITTQQLDIQDTPFLIKDGEAIIPVQGLLTKESSGGLARLIFGTGTSYIGIIHAIEEANLNSEVQRIVLDIDSPGGTVNGAFDAAKAIRNSSKPIISIVSGMALSAAYLLASQTSEIKVINEADRVGSIGVNTRLFASDNVFVVSSTKAPLKNPDPKTQEGIDAIKEELDMTHNLLVKEIATGRGVDTERVNREFGRGATLTSNIAIHRGMVDVIEDMQAGPGIDSNVFAATSAFQDFEIVDIRFNASAATKRIREATGSSESPSKEYKQGFFWYDKSKPSDFNSYKLPFTDISDGKLVAVRNGINAAYAAMQDARGGVDIPQADRAAVQRHIDRYRNKIQKQDEEKNRTTKGGRLMDLQTLFSENPDAREQHEKLVAAAVKDAVTDERDRAVAHLGSIEHSKDAVVKAITDGEPYGNAAQSQYMNAAIVAKQGGAAAADNPNAVNTDENATGDGSTDVVSNALDNLLSAGK